MATQTFHPFPHLPKEIQLQIWHLSLSAIPHPLALLDQFFYTQKPWQWVAFKRPHLSITTLGPPRLECHILVVRNGEALRILGNLLCTCILARQVALEWWRDLVEEWDWVDDFTRKVDEVKITREGLLEVLGVCIRDLGGR